jgi:hypothetical protein
MEVAISLGWRCESAMYGVEMNLRQTNKMDIKHVLLI